MNRQSSSRFFLGVVAAAVIMSGGLQLRVSAQEANTRVRNIVNTVTDDVIMHSAFSLRLRVSVTDDYLKAVAARLSEVKVEDEEREKGYRRFFGHLIAFVAKADSAEFGKSSELEGAKEVKIGVPELERYLALGHCGEMPCGMNCHPCDDKCNACRSH
jgi:hypothetical protein